SVPESIIQISTSAFKDCSTLISVSIQEGVKTIGGSVFSGCNSLNEILLPRTITSIGSFAFRGCHIKRIVLPENLESLSEWGLYGMSNLESITVMKEKPFSLGARAFDETGDCPIFVPSSSVDSYKVAPVWKGYKDRIYPSEE
ncbi:MAG: leucine-rich repeat domain-containing protein, partial [Bacteroidales bacterium]|nr:leucine-rich repeat domain-containing protein [Bacteroidales bacterium]